MQANPAKVLAQTIALQSRPAKALVRTVAMQANPAKAVLTQTLYQAERPAHPSSGMVPVAAPLALAARAVAPVPAAAPAAMRACSPTADPRLMMLADPAGAQAGSFRVLRDTLVTKGIPRVLAITSPEPQDGKTTCAINLALALAERRSERILLIDANFADPALAGILGIDESADASPNRAWTAPFTLSALTPCLHVATIARRPGQSSAYVDFTTFARQLDTFQRAGYQHIILDMPTLDNSSEAKLLLELAGGVLLAVRCGRSKTGALKSAAARIAAGKALGITLLDSPS
jgi:Mrp family chromosome partitioning ATPase